MSNLDKYAGQDLDKVVARYREATSREEIERLRVALIEIHRVHQPAHKIASAALRTTTFTGGPRKMMFGEAIEHALTGKKILRAGWNGKGMWVCYMPPVVIPEGLVNGRTKGHVPNGDLRVGGYFVMWTADGTWQPGWLASQADLLADDWTCDT